MPIYQFHVEDGVSRPDREGTDLKGLKEAKIEAVRLAGSLMRDDPELFITSEEWAIKVTDTTGLHLFSYNFFTTEAPAIAG